MPGGNECQRSPSAILGKVWGPGIGKKARAGRLDFWELLDVVLLLAFAIACLFTLPCLALPCHALPFFSFSLSFPSQFFLHQFPWRTNGRMTKFFPCFATVNLLLVRPPNIRESVCFVAWFSLSRKKKPLLPALHSGIEPVQLVGPAFRPRPNWRRKCRISLDSRGRGV